MSDAAIRVTGLGKQFAIGARQASYQTMRETLVDVAAAPWRWLRRMARREAPADEATTVWALQDVSFEVPRGAIVGVIGHNGAGKSTLLKILSRITEPSSGEVEIHGRVGALLEVGTGFHPELTGRENVFLSGAILGMSRAGIDRQFDEIVAFAEVEKFIDTPVKHYSSGMYLRLAFAVAAHLEPEILLIDEVLAVGDIKFQKKCLGKMDDVAKSGRTVLFVSHNLSAVASLCRTGILLKNGQLARQGPVRDVIATYAHGLQTDETPAGPSRGPVQAYRTRVVGRDENVVEIGGEFTAHTTLTLGEEFWNVGVWLVAEDTMQQLVLHHRVDQEQFPQLLQRGTFNISVRFPPVWLRPGEYVCYFKIIAEREGKRIRYHTPAALFNIVAVEGDNMDFVGLLNPPCEWSMTAASGESTTT